jgi:hypothetical protein
MRRPLTRALLLILATVSVAILCSACGGGQATSVSKKISAAKGGTVSLGDEISLRIPAGALSADATVRVTKATKENPGPEELKSVKAVGPAWNIDLGGQELTAPVTLELTYDPSLLPEGAPEDAVFAAYYDESVGLVAIVRGRVNSDKHVIIVETTHLSWWQPSTWLSYDVTLFFERPYGCLPVDEKRDVCFEYYLHNEDGFRLDPVNLIFVGKNAAEVAKEIDQRLHWGRWCDVPVVSLIICSPLRLSAGSAVADMKVVTPAAQRKQLELTRRGYHIRLYQSPYHPDVVLASVHDDEAQCMLALDVGRDFDKAREVVAAAFETEYQVERLYLGNKLSTQQCGGNMSTASDDGTVAIIRLDRPKATATPTPTATPMPAPTPTPQVTGAPSPTPARPAPTPQPTPTTTSTAPPAGSFGYSPRCAEYPIGELGRVWEWNFSLRPADPGDLARNVFRQPDFLFYPGEIVKIGIINRSAPLPTGPDPDLFWLVTVKVIDPEGVESSYLMSTVYPQSSRYAFYPRDLYDPAQPLWSGARDLYPGVYTVIWYAQEFRPKEAGKDPVREGVILCRGFTVVEQRPTR